MAKGQVEREKAMIEEKGFFLPLIFTIEKTNMYTVRIGGKCDDLDFV